MSRKNTYGGYTLVELLCAIAIASVITLAATSVLLLGMKINRQSSDTVINQSNTRILLSAFEDMSASGTVREIHVEPDSWVIRNEDGYPMMTYQDGVIATGGGMTVMEGVVDSDVKLENNLLTYMVKTTNSVYESSVYCRSVVVDNTSTGMDSAVVDKDDIAFDTLVEGRIQFLDILSTQLGSRGEVMELHPVLNKYMSTDMYYSLWYVGGKTKDDYPGGWDEDTPWCACYVSWAINECEQFIDYDDDDDVFTNDLPAFANVDWFMEDFILRNTYTTYEEMLQKDKKPVAGDIIFFDWNVNDVKDPEHVGVVADIEIDGDKTYIYTIEGNNGDEVVLCKYDITNPYILGYGKLDWLKNPEERE